MRLTIILPTLGVLLALWGCFREDYSFCPEVVTDNVTLRYHLPENGGSGDSFLSDISNVATAIYDSTGVLVQTVYTAVEDHELFQGIKLRLAQGKYKVVSWGNVDSQTVLNEIADLYTGGSATVTYNNIVSGSTGNCDPLYYAPHSVQTRAGNAPGEYVMEVGPSGHEGTLTFRHAHRRVEIFVSGFTSGGITTPVIELTGLPSGLTFSGMDCIEGDALVASRIDSEMVTVNEGGSSVAYARSLFNVFYLNVDDYDIRINIIDPISGNVVYTTRLCDHIVADDPDEIRLRLVFEFLSTGVNVTIPGWSPNDVDYGIFD